MKNKENIIFCHFLYDMFICYISAKKLLIKLYASLHYSIFETFFNIIKNEQNIPESTYFF